MKNRFTLLMIAALGCLQLAAQDVKLNGIFEGFRNSDGDEYTSQHIGYNYDLQKALFVVSNGIYTMTWNGDKLTTPTKEPAVNIADFYSGGQFTDVDKAVWASNFNLMAANSGALYRDGKLWTIFSRDESSTEDEELFAVRVWDAKTGDLLSASNDYYPRSANLESAGMCYNPKDGKVYGLFYLTGQALSEAITSDPEYFEDADDEFSGTDAGYCICTIDLTTMTIKPITPGLYYYNFVTFAINADGRAFALTSGGTAGAVETDGRITDMQGNLAGAQLCEFDLETGLMKTKTVDVTDSQTGETFTEEVSIFEHGTGYCSQYRRQSACFAKSNPNKMYWNGFVNSGKGYNDWGSWGTLPDKEWRTNGKFDTALYEVDINTGEATRLSKITDRYRFSCIWADGDDASDGAGEIMPEDPTSIQGVAAADVHNQAIYSISGQRFATDEDKLPAGIYIKGGKKVVKN